MPAGSFDIAIEKGTTVDIPLTWYTVAPAGSSPGTLVDLTGCTARMQIRAMVLADAILAEFTTENGGLTIDVAAGTIHIKATAVATAAYTWNTGVYDLEVVFAGGRVVRLLKGNVTVDQEVTR